MKHMTAQSRNEMHYIPANNIFAFHLMGGIDGATAEYKKVAEEMRANATKTGYCPACVEALVSWYQASCASILTDIGAGKKMDQTYAQMQLPPCCAIAPGKST